MKRNINIVTIDTQELLHNPYSIFLVDALYETYNIAYYSNKGEGIYKGIVCRRINTLALKVIRNLVRLLLLLYYSVIYTFERRSIKDADKLSVYVSGILVKNVFLFFRFLFRKCSDEVFILVSAGGMPAFAWLSRFKTIRYVYCIYEVYPFQNQTDKHFRNWQFWIEKTGIKKAEMILDTGDCKISSFVLKIYKIKKRVERILIMPEKVQTPARRKTDFPIRFYYHGSYAPNRGLEELVEAMNTISPDKGHLYMRGIGDFENVLKKLTDKFGLNDRITFLAPVPTIELVKEAVNFDVGLVMVKMNIYNHKFVIGFKTFENISAGLALIAPDSYNLHRLVTENKIGILYKDATVDRLSQAMQYCIDHIDEVDRFKMNAWNILDEIGKEKQFQNICRIIGEIS